MKRQLILAPAALFLASVSFAIVDTNDNGLSDLWEKQYNNGELFPQTFDPQADPDGDGWTNAKEAAGGTNPLDPNPPDGYLRPTISHIPPVYLNPEVEGEPDPEPDPELEPEPEPDPFNYEPPPADPNQPAPELLTPGAITVSWPTIPGKQYTLLYSPDLSSGSWQPVEAPFVANGGISEFVFIMPGADKLFYRVAVSDADTDGDGFSDYEEWLAGTDPEIADSDGDGLPDVWEIANGLDPFDNGSVNSVNGADGDLDGDGATHLQEYEKSTAPTDPNDFPLRWRWVANRVEGNSGWIGSSGRGSIVKKNWWGEASPAESLSSDLVPGNLLEALDEMNFPETLSEAFTTHPQAVGKIAAEWGEYAGSDASFYSQRIEYPNSNIEILRHGNFLGTRVWLQAPAASIDQVFPCLKMTWHSSSAGVNTLRADIVDVTVRSGQTDSTYVDLKTSTWIEDGVTHITKVYLIPVEIVVRKKNEKIPSNGVLALTTDVLEIGFRVGEREILDRLENQIAWDCRRIRKDGSFDSWRLLGFGSKCEASIGDGGIYQIRATHLASNRELFYLRRKDEVINGVRYGPGRKGEADAIGICESKMQIDLCRETQKFYTSEKYAPWVALPPEYGFPAYPKEGISIIRCNIFVAHRGCAVGAVVPKINGLFNEYPPLANEWAGIEDTSILPGNPTYIQGWPILPTTEYPQPGWIIAHPNPGDSGHCGIIDYDGEGIGSGSDSGTVNKNYSEFWDGTSRYRKYQP